MNSPQASSISPCSSTTDRVSFHPRVPYFRVNALLTALTNPHYCASSRALGTFPQSWLSASYPILCGQTLSCTECAFGLCVHWVTPIASLYWATMGLKIHWSISLTFLPLIIPHSFCLLLYLYEMPQASLMMMPCITAFFFGPGVYNSSLTDLPFVLWHSGYVNCLNIVLMPPLVVW